MAQQDKKDKLVINVRTVPNGYTLDIEKGEKKQGFMYFNPKKLLDGFIYHVGFEELGEVSEEFRAEVMKAAIAWQDNGETRQTESEIRGQDQGTEDKDCHPRKTAWQEESQGRC